MEDLIKAGMALAMVAREYGSQRCPRTLVERLIAGGDRLKEMTYKEFQNDEDGSRKGNAVMEPIGEMLFVIHCLIANGGGGSIYEYATNYAIEAAREIGLLDDEREVVN